MHYKILFSADTSVNACDDPKTNSCMLKSFENYINDILQYRGYIYLNQIYEILGIDWDVANENHCFIYENESTIDFKHFDDGENGIRIVFDSVSQ